MAKSKITLDRRKRHGTARQRQLALDLFRPRYPDHLTIAEIRLQQSPSILTAGTAGDASKPRKQQASPAGGSSSEQTENGSFNRQFKDKRGTN